MVNLNKIELTKKGQFVNLTKSQNQEIGEILVNLNWNQRTERNSGGFLSSLFGTSSKGGIDLDLGCLYEMTDGSKSCVQALGNAFGSLHSAPFIELDGDDRTGMTSSGENLRINGNKVRDIKRVLVYTFIYEGVANWAEADGIATINYGTGPSIEVRLNEHRNDKNMCAIAMIENVNNETFKVERLVEYFKGHQDMDKAYNWGLSWRSGRK